MITRAGAETSAPACWRWSELLHIAPVVELLQGAGDLSCSTLLQRAGGGLSVVAPHTPYCKLPVSVPARRSDLLVLIELDVPAGLVEVELAGLVRR